MSDSADNNEWNYGVHTVQTLLKIAPERVKRVLVSKQRNARIQKAVEMAKKLDVLVESVSVADLEQQVGAEVNHQGIAVLCSAGEVKDESWLFDMVERRMHESKKKPLLLILDGVTDPHNLGACIRTADGAGVDAIIIPKDNSVGITPVVTKVASGAAQSMPLIVVTNLARSMDKLQQLGIWITGASDQADSTLYDVNLDGPVAIALGAEGKGLRRLTQERCDQLASLPMLGVAESLNVSVATGVCLYEAVRQRSAGKQ